MMQATPQTRANSIGGSDAGAILGVNPYKSRYQLYLEKIGESEEGTDTVSTEAAYWGTVLEDVVAAEYARRRGVSVRRVNSQLTHKKHGWMTAHVDRLVVGTDRLLECKTTNQYMAMDWGEEGTDEVPETYLAQVQHYLAVTGRRVADLAVLIGGQDFRVYEIQRDEELIGFLEDQECEFWICVKERNPPDPSTDDDVRRRWPRDNGKCIMATDAIEEYVLTLKEAKRMIKEREQTKAQLELEIKKFLGEHDTLLAHNGRQLVTWRTAKGSLGFDAKLFEKENSELYQRYVSIRPGSRRFLLK